MHQTEAFLYGRGPGYAALSMPYRDSTLSLLAVLPEHQSLAALERQLNERALTRVIATMTKRNVAVSLPRLHLEAHALLNEMLERLGMIDAFSESADFSGMTSAERLGVGEVIHAADFMVDERGTEAAAVTVVGVRTLGAKAVRHVVAFDADRPFLFFLRDNRTGAVLFAGRVVKPEE
jgi:serpin B